MVTRNCNCFHWKSALEMDWELEMQFSQKIPFSDVIINKSEMFNWDKLNSKQWNEYLDKHDPKMDSWAHTFISIGFHI